MKKYVLIFLSTFVFILMPSIVNAETGYITPNTRTVVFNQQGQLTAGVDLSVGRVDWGDSTISFSFGIYDDEILPYTATVIMSDNVEFPCIVNSISPASNSSDIWFVSSVTCPVVYTTNSYPRRIEFTRAGQGGTISAIYLPDKLSVVKGFSFNDTTLSNNQQATTNAVNDVNNSINNDNVSTNTENSSTASSWASNNASDTVVSDMVLMPITFLNAFSSGFSGSCQAYNLGSLYGTNLTLPCINLQNYLGATLWGIIDVLMSGFLIYGIGKKFVRVFNDFTNLKDSQVDELYGGGN